MLFPSPRPTHRHLYFGAMLLSLHYALTLYINSSFLLQFFDAAAIDSLYMAGSVVTAVCFIVSARWLRRFGNYASLAWGIGLEIIALLTLAFSQNPALIQIAFIAHHALPPLILFGFDLFFEGIIPNNRAEKSRSYYLTFINTAFILAPLIAGTLIAGGSFKGVYILSAIIAGLLWFLVVDMFASVRPKHYHEATFLDSVRKFFRRKYLPTIFSLNLLLHSFFAVMVIFMAPYLNTIIGFDWGSIGILYTIMLLPFVLFEAPLGKLFSRYHDERDVLVVGFILMSISVVLMAFLKVPNILLWAGLLFLSRTGASFVEVATEASFFRRVTDEDAGFVGLFKLAMPISYILIPFVAGFILRAHSFSYILILLGGIMLLGALLSYRKTTV